MMNAMHLVWIIPLCLAVGALIGIVIAAIAIGAFKDW